MTYRQPYVELQKSIQVEWNNAEVDIKAAEIVCANIIIPSIKELRYAGRRLIEALNLINNSAPREQIEPLLNDALFNCYKARHDAIDAATAKIAKELEIKIDKLGYGAVLTAFADFSQLYSDLECVRSKVLISRQNRENRSDIYATISAVDFPKLTERYNRLLACEPLMKGIAAKERRSIVWTWLGWIVALAVALCAWAFPDLLKSL